MSHFQVAEEIRRTLAFSADLNAEPEVHEAIGESFFRVVGQDGHTYGLLVRRIDQPVDLTGEIVLPAPEENYTL